MNRTTYGAIGATIVLTLALVLGGGLYAQQRGEGPMGGMMGNMMAMMKNCPMHQGMAERPGMALKHREELALTGEQVGRLEALQARSAAAHRTAMEEMTAIHGEIAAAASGDRFDEAAVRAAFDRMGDLHTEMGVAMMRTRHEVRAVLTSEQREKLAGLGGGMMGMMGMMGMGGMQGMDGMDMDDCPMMKGMMGGMRMGGDSAGRMQHH